MTTPDSTGMNSFYVADWEVRPRACEITRGDTVVKLEPRVMDLLQLFASRPGEVLSRMQLEEQVWPGMVVGYDALTKSIGKLRDALGDTEKPQTFIQTIPKKGYRLIAPVSAGDTKPAATTTITPLVSPKKNRTVSAGLLILAVVVISIILFTFNLLKDTEIEQHALSDSFSKPSLVVLPFKNLNDDPLQDYFSRGITDDMIVDLSRYSGIEVIGSHIAFQYQGRNVDLDTLVKELKVRYVVEGSIRRSQQQIRINVQMTDALRGINLWAEQYNRPITGLFDIQDEVRSKIVNALSIKFTEAERNREQKRYTNNFDAYDAFLLGQASLIKRASEEDNQQAREQFEKAIAIDPGFARAYAALAMANADAYRHNWVDDPDSFARVALQQAQHAINLDPKSHHASLAMGYIQIFVAKDHQQAIAMAERTLQLDPNNPDANMLLATVYVHADEPNKAEAYVETSMRQNPDHSSIYLHINALANLLRNDFVAAHDNFEKSLMINPERFIGKIYMTITLVRMNEIEGARWVADEIKYALPQFDAKQWAMKQPYKDKRIIQQLREDLRKAGL
jgi:TolB-like protein/DNA-binding winged helix-turn-helix (wHTH) protein